ncbi:MAG TPA: hypothetical protein VH988_34560 [Thermoanaerobaculia bacterium]|nr:hypothetical protein [Thermoanaerobaculia bacterium]
MTDISPNDRNGGSLGINSSPTGVITGLAGDGHALYAVSLNAGIWKSVDGGAWQQLPGSPPRAYCIAQDPNDAAHLVAGERRTEAIKPQNVGVWESRDAGATWSYVLDPSKLPGSTSQAVAAVMVSGKSTAFAGTATGIGRKAVGHSTFDFTANPLGQFPGERLTAFARSESNDVFLEERLAGVSPAGDVLLYSWTPKLNWRVANLSAATGVRAKSALTNWQTPNGPFHVEHLAFTDAAGHVIVLYSSERADWQVVDVTAKTGQVIQGPLTSWQTPNGPFNVEHLAGVTPAGDVIVFVWSPAHDWQAINVSQKTGNRLQNGLALTSWQTPNGPLNVEHLAGVDAAGHVIVFYWSPAHDWQSVDVTAKTGQQSTTALTSWQTPNGPLNVEHLAGVNPAGHVIVFYWSSAHDWQAVDVTAKTGQQSKTALTSWQTPNGPFNVEHLAGVNPAGHVIVFYWSSAHDWQTVDVTAKTGRTSNGALTSWQTPNGPFNVEHLAGVNPAGEVIVFWWSPAHDWQAIDVSSLTGTPASGVLTSWQISKRLQFLWARSESHLFFSPDDGLSWFGRAFVRRITIPQTTVGTTTVPAGTYDVDTDIRPNGGDERLGLAAVDTSAYVTCKIFVTGTRTDPAGNHSIILIHDLLADQWSVQIMVPGDGTGLGGRRFLKSYVVDKAGLPGGIGGRARLFASSADDIQVATGISGGIIQWQEFASSFIGARGSDRIHSDFWDFHLAADGNLAWVGCDGGLFEGQVASDSWSERNDGLHTHHAHTLNVLQVSATQRSKLVYPTADNDGWYRTTSTLGAPAPAWINNGSLGDAVWTAADAGNPSLAVIARRIDDATLVAFGETPPPGSNFTEGAAIAIKNDSTFDGPLGFQCIQTLQGESPTFPLLDAVMLVNLPLLDGKGNPVPGPLGLPDPSGLPSLVRNTRFAAAPSAASLFAGWTLESKHLPAGTRGFWIAGGHAKPVYYAYAPLAGSLTLFKRNAGKDTWHPLPLNGLSDGAIYGPCFINPYDEKIIFGLTASGVQVSRNGGVSFTPDTVLTNLITGSGTYPLSGAVDVAGPIQELGGRARAVNFVMSTLTHMAFLRDDPTVAVAASPFTGVFYHDGKAWHDLSGALPKPLAPVSAVGIDGRAIYVTFEGRSIVEIDGYP